MGTIYGDILWGRTYSRACRGKLYSSNFLHLVNSGPKNGSLHHELTYFLLRILLLGVLRQITMLTKIGLML